MLCLSQPQLVSAVQRASSSPTIDPRRSLRDVAGFLERFAPKVPFAKTSSSQIRIFLDKTTPEALETAVEKQGQNEFLEMNQDPTVFTENPFQMPALPTVAETDSFENMMTDKDLRNWMTAPTTTLNFQDGLGDSWATDEDMATEFGHTFLDDWMSFDPSSFVFAEAGQLDGLGGSSNPLDQ
jgi:hypothetical protein